VKEEYMGEKVKERRRRIPHSLRSLSFRYDIIYFIFR